MMGILALVLTSAATVPADGRVVQQVEHYAIEVPAGYVLKDVSPKMMDFELYALTEKRTGKAKCTLYVGNQPAFPKLRWSGKPVESRQSGGTRKEFRSSDRVEGLMTFQDVTYKDSGGSPFQTIHYFAEHLSAPDMTVLAAMLDSITVTRKELK
jgi:hypothetical protein